MRKTIFDNPILKDTHIFEITESPYKSPFYNDSLQFKVGEEELGIIDFYNGKLPMALNKEFMINGKMDICHITTLILDSNVLNALHNYVSNYENMNEDRKKVIKKFLMHVSKIRCDYSPIFYLLENYQKSSREQFIKTSSEKLYSLLKLHSMKTNIFEKYNRIESDEKALKYYYNLYQAKSLEECSKKWVESFLNNKKFLDLNNMINLSYACLLKMTLINYMFPKNDSLTIQKKYFEFKKFMIEVIGVNIRRESLLSLYYFAGFAGKFISIQPNSTYENALKNLKSTSWDLFLIKTPEYLMTPNNLPEINTSFVVTFEKKLFDFGKLFSIEKIIYKSKDEHSITILGFDLSLFSTKIDKFHLDEIIEEDEKTLINRLEAPLRKSISEYDLKCLINDLEIQLSIFLSRK